MKVSVSIDGADRIREGFANLADAGRTGVLLRKGMSNAGRIQKNAQRNLAPVRKGGLKIRRMRPEFIGPRNQIKPGQLKRSIFFRVRKAQTGVLILKTGMNVGLKRNDQRRAPHAHLVGLGTKQRFSNGRLKGGEYGPKRANRGVMPQNRFIADATNFAANAALRAMDAGFDQEVVSVLKGRTKKTAPSEPAGAQ